MQTSLIEPDELAKRWKITPLTLAQWRWSGKGPRFIRMGRHTFYRPQDIEAYEEKKAKQSMTDTYEGDHLEVILESKFKNRRSYKR